jgi:polyhydroxyalkanoate synthesis regulator phasin
MKQSVKKFFLLGLGIAAAGVAAGVAYKNRAKIKKAADELVQKGKLVKEDANDLVKELVLALERLEKKAVRNIKKKVSKK